LPGDVADVRPFDRDWFKRHPVRVAFDLIGAFIVVDRDNFRVAARIVEVEAYGGDEDGASHATMYRSGLEALRSDPGVLYMQFAYGMHTMTNIVAHVGGGLGAVLLRAADDPTEGLALVQGRRDPKTSPLLVGPGCLSQGIGTRMSDTLKPLDEASGVRVEPGSPAEEVRASPRIGISRGTEARWRFFEGASRSVSKHRRGEIVHAGDLDAIIADLPECTAR